MPCIGALSVMPAYPIAICVEQCVHVGVICAGMDPEASYIEPDTVDGHVHLKPGTGGSFSPPSALRPGRHSPHLPSHSLLCVL